jgi:hypothetical protein
MANMSENEAINGPVNGSSSFDLFRLSKSKVVVDLTPNTLRAYHSEGLPFYRRGRAVFVSKSELALFLRSQRVRKAN